MKKKKRVSLFLTIDPDLHEKLEEQIKMKFIDKSLLIDGLIRKWLEENNSEPVSVPDKVVPVPTRVRIIPEGGF